MRAWRINRPWEARLSYARARCNNPKINNFHRYGGRGIKCLLTKDEAKALWVRDGADDMKRPSLDRINADGHYEMANCRFIEQAENAGRRCNGRPVSDGVCYRGHIRTPENTFTKTDCRTGKSYSHCYKCYQIQHGRDPEKPRGPDRPERRRPTKKKNGEGR
jgi:hypothetical protein